jgi:hypothetical protein
MVDRSGNIASNSLFWGLTLLDTPLETQYDAYNIRPEVYGHSALFFQFLTRNCGGPALAWGMTLQSQYKGLDMIENGIKQHAGKASSLCSNFETLIGRFEVSRAFNDEVYTLNSEGVRRRDTSFILYPFPLTRAKPTLRPLTLETLNGLPRFTPLLYETKGIKIPEKLPPNIRTFYFRRNPTPAVVQGPVPNPLDYEQVLFLRLSTQVSKK